MEIISANATGKTRRAKLRGCDYIVADASLINPGVLNGSQGRLFYPSEEVAKDTSAWNGIPVVVRHPVKNGIHVSARSPEVFDEFGVGHVFQSTFNGKHVAEVWLDVDAIRRHDLKLPSQHQMLPRLDSGSPIELSTGLFTHNTPAEPGAAYNGAPYDFVARNYKPDHLAVLPDQVGACSIADGCGINVNDDGLLASFWKWLTSNAGKFGKLPSKELISNASGESYMATREQTIAFLTANCDCWKGKEKVLANKDAFTDDDLAKLKANADKMQTLVANAAKMMTEEDCKKMMADQKKPATNQQDANVNANVTTTPKPLTDQEWLASAPSGVQSAVRNAMAVEKRERQRIIGMLVANVAEGERDEVAKELNTESLEKLTKLLKLVPTGNTAPANEPLYILPGNFQGAAGGPVGIGGKDDSDNVLPTFNIDWNEAAKQTA